MSIGLLFQAEASSLIDLLVPALADVGVELVPESTEGPGGLFPRKFMGAYDTIVFDAWYYTPTDFPSAASYNKQAFITGQKTGTEILSTE